MMHRPTIRKKSDEHKSQVWRSVLARGALQLGRERNHCHSAVSLQWQSVGKVHNGWFGSAQRLSAQGYTRSIS
jgi:nitroimidazol reductase NimA-like FMN-containing flavoprotein (pyridoxamine 5'-phosphate oxidase superfamily)